MAHHGRYKEEQVEWKGEEKGQGPREGWERGNGDPRSVLGLVNSQIYNGTGRDTRHLLLISDPTGFRPRGPG
jgi:hypothetical protein